MEPGTRTAAFFDLDKTLLSVNSGAMWIQRERRLGRITRLQMLEGGVKLLAYRMGMIDMEAAMRRALAIYKGIPEATVERWTREWYHEEVAQHVSEGGRAAMDQHRQAGHLLVLLTSSSPYASATVSEHLGLDAWISTRYGVEDGVFTGEPELPLCYGEGKVVRAEAWASEAGVELDRSYFYSDSYTDLPMLERVGNPGVVNPDPRLRVAARQRGWPIFDWHTPRGPATRLFAE
jgi:HAD superfamily hydrolase (TIGR01490 family)